MARGLLACGMIGPLLFIATFAIEGWLRPGYRVRRHFVSTLATGRRGWVQIVNFLQCGVLVSCLAVGLWPGAGAAPWLFGVVGLGLILAGLFPTDSTVADAPASYAARSVSPVTRAGAVHNVASLAVFAALSAAACVMAVRFARTGHPGWAAYSAASAIVVVVFFVRGGIAISREARGEIADAPFGRLQRCAIIPGWTWVAVVAAHLVAAP